MEALILINSLALVAAFVILILPTYKMKRRLDEAYVRTGEARVSADLAGKFQQIRLSAGIRATGLYWLIQIALAIVAVISTQVIVAAIEPRATVMTWIVMNLLFYGIGLIGLLFMLNYAVVGAWQVHKLNQWVDAQVVTYPSSVVLKDVKEYIRPRIGEVGLSVLASVTVIGSIAYGLALFAIFFLAAQAAIECARSSKCM